ncbi:hypothetical protein HDU89_003234 [Geranomyces variabilis]|nr:hypothetical protein HDU89_003234 [Geranomyces variabilis]
MKRSNDFAPQAPTNNSKKPRFSPQSPINYSLESPPTPSDPISLTDIYRRFGSMNQYMSVLNGMGAMSLGGMAGHQQHQSGSPATMATYQGMSHGHQFPAAGPPQYSPNGYSTPFSHLQYHGGGTAYQNVQAFNHTMRTIYLGNLPTLVTYEEVINLVKGGALEQVKILEEKNCAFITFLEASSAHAFHADCQSRRPTLGTYELKVGWGKHSPIPPPIMAAVQGGASRNVFVGNIDDGVNEATLAQDFSRFGPIDQIKILAEKRIAFIHMASIVAAMKAVQNLSNEARWSSRRINYGKDRCAYHIKSSSGSSRSTPPSTPGSGIVYGNGISYGQNLVGGVGYGLGFSDHFNGMNPAASGNRTVYLGSIHSEVTTKDLCDVIRGGILQNIKYMPDKNIAFVTFVDPASALSFYNRGSYEGISLKGKRLKFGWGKPSPLPASIAQAVQANASRNVYIGALDDSVTEDTLRRDFSEFGDIELVNIIADKNIGFVNFADLNSAVKAVETLKADESRGYRQYRIAFGKDRCGNPPRPPRESAAQRAAAVAAAAAAASDAIVVAGGSVAGGGPNGSSSSASSNGNGGVSGGTGPFVAGGMVQQQHDDLEDTASISGLLVDTPAYLDCNEGVDRGLAYST